MKTLLFVLTFLSCSAWGLVPVEGILMGEAENLYQSDPLARIFSDIYDTSDLGHNKKVKLYHSTWKGGDFLVNSCGYYSESRYPTTWMEKQAKRGMVATLQYVGLDTTIRAIGAYAKKLEIGEEEYKKLTNNLMTNHCSKNVTTFSLKRIKQSLEYYYKNPQDTIIPNIGNSPFATQLMKDKTAPLEVRAREFDFVLKNFRAFCSWGGDVQDYRLMAPYLNNRYIMSFVIKNMVGMQDTFDEKEQKIKTVKSPDTVQVQCTDLICRKTTEQDMLDRYPLSIGSTGLLSDLTKLYCHHFRFQDYKAGNTLPEIKAWMKESELEDPIFETNTFISLMTGVPDLMMAVGTYQEIPMVLKSSMDERWVIWAKDVLGLFSRDLLFEESLKVRPEPRRDILSLSTEGFLLDFSVTLGEMDRLLDGTDKLKLKFELNLSKNYLRDMKTKWNHFSSIVDTDGQKELKKEIARYLEIQLKDKEKLFTQKMWTNDFSRLLAEELLDQVLTYRGPLFETYKDEMLAVPVKFSYGIFALGYLRYRADVKAGRLKLNL